MTIAEILVAMDRQPDLAGDLLRAMAERYMHRHFRADSIARADVDTLRWWRHEAFGCLILHEYAFGDAGVLCEMAGAALEDNNHHADAAKVRELAYA